MLGDQFVQHWLSPPDSSTYHDFVSKRHRGTAAWFFECNKLTEWKETGSLLWIHGKRMFFERQRVPGTNKLVDLKAGAGKSTLLYVMTLELLRGYS